MNKGSSRAVGVISIVLSIVSAAASVYFMAVANPARMKHGLLLAVIFIVLLVFGISRIRAKASPDAPAARE